MSALPRSIRAQQARRGELFEKRGHHGLTPAEAAEAERLDSAFYHREWRAAEREAAARRAAPQEPAALNPRVLAQVAELRAQQLTRFGHTVETDDARCLKDWGMELRKRAQGIHETLQLGPRATARAQALRLIALSLALVDRLDRESQENHYGPA